MKKLLLSVAVVAAAVATVAGTASSAPPLTLHFTKHWVGPGHYVGTIAEGGTIDMQISNSRVTGDVQHFDATVQIDSAGRSFTAEVAGIFNFSTFRTTLNGEVTDGWSAGSQVLEEGLLVDPSTYTFEGALSVMAP
jgi:ABC-type glycerol-3-phosphate transport system substrate-binding protein